MVAGRIAGGDLVVGAEDVLGQHRPLIGEVGLVEGADDEVLALEIVERAHRHRRATAPSSARSRHRRRASASCGLDTARPWATCARSAAARATAGSGCRPAAPGRRCGCRRRRRPRPACARPRCWDGRGCAAEMLGDGAAVEVVAARPGRCPSGWRWSCPCRSRRRDCWAAAGAARQQHGDGGECGRATHAAWPTSLPRRMLRCCAPSPPGRSTSSPARSGPARRRRSSSPATWCARGRASRCRPAASAPSRGTPDPCMVASNAVRSAATRSAGTPGPTTMPRPNGVAALMNSTTSFLSAGASSSSVGTSGIWCLRSSRNCMSSVDLLLGDPVRPGADQVLP